MNWKWWEATVNGGVVCAVVLWLKGPGWAAFSVGMIVAVLGRIEGKLK